MVTSIGQHYNDGLGQTFQVAYFVYNLYTVWTVISDHIHKDATNILIVNTLEGYTRLEEATFIFNDLT